MKLGLCEETLPITTCLCGNENAFQKTSPPLTAGKIAPRTFRWLKGWINDDRHNTKTFVRRFRWDDSVLVHPPEKAGHNTLCRRNQNQQVALSLRDY
jgi:hypothetical protein